MRKDDEGKKSRKLSQNNCCHLCLRDEEELLMLTMVKLLRIQGQFQRNELPGL
jgi:hypothetical protein